MSWKAHVPVIVQNMEAKQEDAGKAADAAEDGPLSGQSPQHEDAPKHD